MANRANPVSVSSELRISNGNLALLDQSKSPIWSTNVSTPANRSVKAVLLDTGNLVLVVENSDPPNRLWESFDHPTHTWLPGAKLGFNKKTKTSQVLRAWNSATDPAPGIFSHRMNPQNNSTDSLWNNSKRFWSTGPWNGLGFPLIPEMRHDFVVFLRLESNEEEIYFTFSVSDNASPIATCHFEMSVTGQIEQVSLLNSTGKWDFCPLPQKQCEVYALCGPYGSCVEASSAAVCLCLPGFEPKSQSDWASMGFSGGCVRRSGLGCETDRFLEIPNMSLPENKRPVEASGLRDCESKCMRDCSCVAYVYDDIGCSIWNVELLNLKRLGAGDRGLMTLNLRVSDFEYQRLRVSLGIRKVYVGLIGLVSTFGFVSFAAFLVYYPRRRRRRDSGREENSICFREEECQDVSIPFVSLKTIMAATDNFSEANKLGEGGFGPVYKVVLVNFRDCLFLLVFYKAMCYFLI